jgi:putative cardiolipin synthase
MHNKSFTADNQVSIVGGRNIGDEYLGAQSAVEFDDLDVLVAGPVVNEISTQFDLYWNSASAYPAASLIAAPPAESAEQVRVAWSKLNEDPRSAKYLEAMRNTPVVRQLLGGGQMLEWVPARLVHDDPDKVLHPPEEKDLQMLPHLTEALGRPERELDLVSPYFVPTQAGTAALRTLADSGVKLRVLTNSLAATDVGPVYAGYSKYRVDLLRGGGVRLFELKPGAQAEADAEERKQHGVGGSTGGSSAASLHAKTFGVDRSRIFVGSFNLDPRSARLNTEMGVVLESAALATRLAKAFESSIPQRAYEVRLTPDGNNIEWFAQTGAGEVSYDSSPETGPLRRLWIWFLSILPIEWLL